MARNNKRQYNVVYLCYNEQRDDLETLGTPIEFGTDRCAAIKRAKEISLDDFTPQGQTFQLAAVECYTETEMTTYQPLYLDCYLNGVRVGRVNQ